ncbi:DUF2510 domain-containing protein [Microbacterium sp. STF-2]|uniref:DUF2510 domain-containing protein n=1 Tax=Microbacterium sp. STF-2 TaxID=3031132 RepID=UPI002AFF95A7|nr:DUF2510 domain-containing protein [Microbacterium sp. STF-2]MEA1264447.1 DUF2510 domain-containing protein [Microbacterium sp. STF-2]
MRDDEIPAGWFDTRRRGTRRWWDGTRWTSHISVRGRETTMAEDSASVRRQLLVCELVLGAVMIGAILIALWGSLPVVVVRPVIVATGTALVVMPFLITRQLRRVALPARGAGVPTRR